MLEVFSPKQMSAFEIAMHGITGKIKARNKRVPETLLNQFILGYHDVYYQERTGVAAAAQRRGRRRLLRLPNEAW